jgi:hypothetical protein
MNTDSTRHSWGAAGVASSRGVVSRRLQVGRVEGRSA